MKSRPRWLLILLGALVVTALFTYPTWHSALNTWLASRAGGSTGFANVSAEQRDLLLQMRRTPNADPEIVYQSMLITVPAPTTDAPTPDPALAQPIRSGSFVTIDPIHTASGHATLYRMNDNSLLLRFDGFTVTNGPGLSVYLSANAAPLTIDDLQTDKLQLLLGPLKGTSGAQNYTRIPPELDLTRYKSVAIVSDPLKVIYSNAPLH
ncbi:MAG: DM13 domain-containing protein [Aggregatilineales bacterium]